MACRSCRPNEGRVDGAHGAAAVTKERQGPATLAAGHTTKELAAALNVRESTVEWHVSNILVKLGAASRAEAVAIGLREGLLEPEEQPLTGRSAPDLATSRAHRARAWRDDRVIQL